MTMKRILLLFLLFCGGYVHAQELDSARIHYRQGHREVDVLFRDNRAELERFIRTLREEHGADRLESVVIRSWASPEGVNRLNGVLSERRADSLKSYLVRHAGIPDSLICIHGEGIAWDMLRQMVAASDILYKEEVLHILDHTPVWVFDKAGRVVDGRKKQLMELCGGKIYRLLQERFFAELRNCTIELHYTTGDAPGQQIARVHDSMPHPAASIQDRPRTDEADRTTPNEQHPKQAPGQIAEQVPGTASVSARHEPLYRLAIKTNLLYDAVGMPSLEAEYRIDDRWSVNLEGEVAWWSKKPRHRYYQIATISPEARYWFKTRQPWHGHYMGVFVGGSWYDLENGACGYKGDFWMVGLSYGYMFPLGRRLSLETGLGIGFLHTEYEEYLPIDGHYVYQQTSRTNWLGPVKLKFALVWRLWDANRKGGAR